MDCTKNIEYRTRNIEFRSSLFVIQSGRGVFAGFICFCILVLLLPASCRKKTPTPPQGVPTVSRPQADKRTIKEVGHSAELSRSPAPKKEEPVQAAKIVMPSSLSGRWYSADAGALSQQIDGFFRKAGDRRIDNVIALILPHAGYQWSGQTAAFGLKTTDNKYKRIVVIGPSHGTPMEEMLSVPRVTHYETPLGQIPLDTVFINKLLQFPMFQNVPQVHRYEHSVQIELPLLQRHFKSFKFVPIVAGSCSLETIDKAAAIVGGLIDKETLIIASSDFVHYGRAHRYVPFTENIPERIRELDMGAVEVIGRLDSKGFLEYKAHTGATICGYIPIAILLSALDEGVKAELIKYTTSGELTGDFTNSVSYASIAFSGVWSNYPEVKPPPLFLSQESRGAELSDEDKKQLLDLARKTILYAVEQRRVPRASELDVTISDAMKRPRAAFVTLKKNVVLQKKRNLQPEKTLVLRGCIGDIFPQRPLYRSVIINAINAAFRDSRFPPVTGAECDDITIEISALTAPKPIASAEQIRIGIDGIVLKKNGQSAVYLPQVAPEQGWDLNQTLTNLSLKAKLPVDAWKEGASFLVFQAVVFGEEK
ncbi:MAG TPA: AmmeMemoRadiSam system protein B [Planctomycetes bacterium]|nr:AmmeMemoRadiSam system protein B [Planctomycetota bacterium]